MSPPRVLVAEDNRMVSLLLSRTLEMAGIGVTTTYDGIEAYEAGKSGEFDLAVITQVMPGLLGAEVLYHWNREGIDTPVIMTSGLSDNDEVVRVLDMGAVDFVRKPFHMQEVLARVNRHLRYWGRIKA